jgi:hypothetical protein
MKFVVIKGRTFEARKICAHYLEDYYAQSLL